MESFRQDVRLGIRLLLKQPGFSLLAIGTLAIGIGLSTALFSVLDAAFIRPLPYPNPEQLVEIRVETLMSGGRTGLTGPAIEDLEDFRAHGQVLSQIAHSRYAFTEPLVIDGPEPLRVLAQRVSRDYFDLYGVSPFLGRAFNDDDMHVGAPNVVMLGHAFWRTAFGADRSIVGRAIKLNDESATIVGVLPSTFYPRTKLWRPNPVPPASFSRRGGGGSYAARLRPGMSLQEAEAALTAVSARAAAARGGTGATVKLRSMYDSATRSNVATAKVIAYAVGLVLLLACVNVAGLLLAKGAGRRAELAVRSSLGAGRPRLIRQLLTESVVLSLTGGALGVLLAWISLDVLVANVPMSLPSNAPVALNTKALIFGVLASLATGIVFGLIPAWRVSRVQLSGALAGAGRGHGTALSRRGGQLLIALEIAMAVILLAGGALMVRSFARLAGVDVGVDPGKFVSMSAAPASPAVEAFTRYYPALIEKLRAHPAIQAAGAVDHATLGGSSSMTFATVDGKNSGVSVRRYIGAYFDAIGFSLKQGQFPTAAQPTGGLPPAVVNEVVAAKLFAGGPVVGRQIIVGKVTYEIVAVAGNVRHNGPLWERETDPEVFMPAWTRPDARPLSVIARRRQGATLPPNFLRESAHATGQRAVVEDIKSGSEFLSDLVSTPRQRTVLLGLLGSVGFLLALVGVFGMTAYAVTRRTREIGVRMAFGATQLNVVNAMLRDSIVPVVFGVAAGLIGSWWATGVLKAFLFETEPRDLATFASVALLLAVTALIAAWIPARRAARVDPIVALRSE